MRGLLEAVREKGEIADFLGANPLLHAYELGDLDDVYFPRTQWFGWRVASNLEAVALIYHAVGMPVLIVLDDRDPSPCADMIEAMREAGHLSGRLYAHLTTGLVGSIACRTTRIRPHGRHLKMGLSRKEALEAIPIPPGIVTFEESDADELGAFYAHSYPGNWFDPWMLRSGLYVGLREDGETVAVAGVHVHSPSYGVAALGNVATSPARRGRGLATGLCAALCRRLLPDIPHISLNVDAANRLAIRVYESLGFTVLGDYYEFEVS